jgi:peptide/nickel transport system substrate-binding protein
MRKLALLASIVMALGGGCLSAQAANDFLTWADTLPHSLDPHAVFDTEMQFVIYNVYDGLYRYEDNPPKLEPWLAESYTVSPDGLTWDFKLRHNVKFHDGSELTAQDVVYSFQRLLALGKAPSGAFKPVLKSENVSAVDRYTVRFVLSQPYAPFLSAIPIVAIVNPRAIAPHATNNDWGAAWLSVNDAGSGAYKVVPDSFHQNESLDLARFPDYFKGWSDNPKPIDSVKVRPVAETSTRVLALLNGEIDATDSYLPVDQIERIEKSGNARVSRDESMRLLVVTINNSKPPLDNLHFRRCLNYAFNYDGFIHTILHDTAVRNSAPIPKNLWGYPEGIKGYDFDLAKAKTECDTARSEGANLKREFQIHTQSEAEQTNQAAQLFQSDLQQLGIRVKIIPEPWAQLTANTAKAETTPDMWIHWVSTYFVDPENWIGQMYDSQFHGTWKASSWYKNDDVDKLLRDARRNTNREERAKDYQEAARLVVDDATDIWVYNTVQLRGLSKRLQGFHFNPVNNGSEIRTMYLKNE